ncbi:astacin-like metalloprotease toxin 5 isoform X2 [Amblyomma americanum]
MRSATMRSIALCILATTTQKALLAPLSDEASDEIHEAVLAMMAGYFEGDIIMPETDSRAGINDPPKKWSGGVVPYEVDRLLDREFEVVQTAMTTLQNETCLRFVKRSNQPDYLYLFIGDGCYSYFGRIGGEQPLSLGRGCLYMTTVAHELLHALGFHHEHTRPDRDDHLNVKLDNVIPTYRNQFEKRKWSSEAVVSPFDISSVMEYGSDAFARSKSQPTILTKDGQRIIDVYEKKELSYWDFKRVNDFYDCK